MTGYRMLSCRSSRHRKCRRTEYGINRLNLSAQGTEFLLNLINTEILWVEENGHPECVNIQIIALPGGCLFQSIHRNICYYIRRKDMAVKPAEAHTGKIPCRSRIHLQCSRLNISFTIQQIRPDNR